MPRPVGTELDLAGRLKPVHSGRRPRSCPSRPGRPCPRPPSHSGAAAPQAVGLLALGSPRLHLLRWGRSSPCPCSLLEGGGACLLQTLMHPCPLPPLRSRSLPSPPRRPRACRASRHCQAPSSGLHTGGMEALRACSPPPRHCSLSPPAPLPFVCPGNECQRR